MDRRRFIQSMAAATAAMDGLAALTGGAENAQPASQVRNGSVSSLSAKDIDITGYTSLCSFQRQSEVWKVYEDLRVRDGAIAFLSDRSTGLVLTKSAEAARSG